MEWNRVVFLQDYRQDPGRPKHKINGNLPNSKIQHPVYHKIRMLRGAIAKLCFYKLGLMMKNVFKKLKKNVLSSFGMSN